MNINIDMTEIFEDENGGSIKLTLADRIIESITDKVLKNYKDSLDKAMTACIDKKLSETVGPVLDKKIEELFSALLDYEFTEVTSWGAVKGKNTLRTRIIDAVEKNSHYKSDNYRSNENVFTCIIKDAVTEHVKQFNEEMRKLMTDEFKKECIAAAAKNLTEKYT